MRPLVFTVWTPFIIELSRAESLNVLSVLVFPVVCDVMSVGDVGGSSGHLVMCAFSICSVSCGNRVFYLMLIINQ